MHQCLKAFDSSAYSRDHSIMEIIVALQGRESCSSGDDSFQCIFTSSDVDIVSGGNETYTSATHGQNFACSCGPDGCIYEDQS